MSATVIVGTAGRFALSTPNYTVLMSVELIRQCVKLYRETSGMFTLYAHKVACYILQRTPSTIKTVAASPVLRGVYLLAKRVRVPCAL